MIQITILSHNAFWFQGVPFPGDRPPDPDGGVIERLCAVYREIHPDVVCLQEIQSRETFERVSVRLGMPGCYCPGTSLPQYGGATCWRPGAGRLLARSLDSAIRTQRMWQTIEVEGGRVVLRICNIHLPSSRHLGRDRAAAQRIVELEDSIHACGRGPDVIAGDFNEAPGGPLTGCLDGYGYVDTAVCFDSDHVPTNTGGGRGDYIWIKKKLKDRIVTYAVADKQRLACDIPGKQYLSDHLPLWITVEV